MVIFSLSIPTPKVHTGSCEGNRKVVSAIFQPNHYTSEVFGPFLLLRSDQNVYNITRGRVFLTLLLFYQLVIVQHFCVYRGTRLLLHTLRLLSFATSERKYIINV